MVLVHTLQYSAWTLFHFDSDPNPRSALKVMDPNPRSALKVKDPESGLVVLDITF